ncbi:MAG: exodeoxyribonuclease VII small subunit [Kistimonas sp.]|nr:exodeoxyribonuclease VII small subunit [Kistimonas sp.]
MDTSSPDTDRAFESALTALESKVRELESGDLPLEQALEAFEQGVKLSQHCQQTLDAAEMKVQLLREQGGAAELQPFDDNAN